MRGALDGTKLFAAVPDLLEKFAPPSVETNVVLAPNAQTIISPSFDISKAVHVPAVTGTEVIAASPSFHFFKPPVVAIHT